MSRRHAYDVAVVGGGPAGVAAAASAAGGGSVVLIESAHRLGGSVTAAMHRCLCGLYAGPPRDALDTLNGLGQRAIVARMAHHSRGGVIPRQFGKAWVLEFPAGAWELALADFSFSPDIDLRLGTRVTGVEREEDGRVATLELEGASPGRVAVKAVIDCTGGGSLLQLVGEDAMLPADELAGRMLGGFAVRLGNLEGNLELLRLQTPYALAKAVADGALPAVARFTVFYPGPGGDEGVCKLAVRPEDFSSGEAEAMAGRVVAHLMKEVAGFAAARVVERSPQALPRDGRRLRGRFVLSQEDVLAGRKHGHAAVHAWWPIEHWDISQGPTYAYPPEGDHYDIPNDALRSAVVENLLAGGACLSATAGAAASARASGVCLATGDAAGRLAAILTSTNEKS